jgi:hypothetical protein
MGMICDILLTPAKTYKNHPVAVEFLSEMFSLNEFCSDIFIDNLKIMGYNVA